MHTKTLLKAAIASAVAMVMAPSVMASEKINMAMCTMCHQDVSAFHQKGAHKGISCDTCHTGLEKHQSNPGKETRPATKIGPEPCATCHKPQYESLYKANDKKIGRISKKLTTGPSPDPFFDRAMGKHGFTKEHDEPRSHVFMTFDQVIYDRSYGGRFQPKDGWLYLTYEGGAFNLQDKIKDMYPDNNQQKPHRYATAAAINPVCQSCKTSDLMLDWAFLGDKTENAKWSRQSNPVEIGRELQHAINCNFCHDPHSTQPRIIRDALIDALTRKDFPTVYSEDPNHTKIEVHARGVQRGIDRKIATMEKADSKLMCGQCHVEYNCNPGQEADSGKPITMADRRTNVFPFAKVKDVQKFYDHINFRDFKHPMTGAKLLKFQHPDTETFWGSKHDKAGVTCQNCHMPKVKGEDGKMYTLHWNTSPRNYMKETCLSCHKDKTEAQMNRVITGMKAYYMGKLRETESRMNEMFDAFNEALNAGVSEDVLNKAREQHTIAHSNWESWTAVNGAYFHNVEEAVQSMDVGAKAAETATKILRDAIRAKADAKAGAKKSAKKVSKK